MPRAALFLILALTACNGDPTGDRSAPASDDESVFIPADDDGRALQAVIDAGLSAEGKGPDLRRFVLIRAIDRHDPRVPDSAFHFVVGAGVELPAGSIRARRVWSTAGEVDGDNSELQKFSVAVGVERGAPRPFGPEVVDAVGRICAALVRPETGLQIHPDCVVAMSEVPFARPHELGVDEELLARAARTRVAKPMPHGTLGIDGAPPVAYELRDTPIGREIGMMMRRSFDGENRGMLFVYPHKANRRFWMRNCLIPIDLAYIKGGEIVQIETMPAQAGVPTADLPRYESITPVRYVLEMPAGWFAQHGVAPGAGVTGLPE